MARASFMNTPFLRVEPRRGAVEEELIYREESSFKVTRSLLLRSAKKFHLSQRLCGYGEILGPSLVCLPAIFKMTAEKQRPDLGIWNIVAKSRDLALDTLRAGRAPYVTVAVSIAIVARWIYLLYRIKYILLAGSGNGQSTFTAWLLFAVELGFSGNSIPLST